MINTISKTDFVRYLDCPRYAWLCKHRKDLLTKEPGRFVTQGNEVEKLAHKLFPEGREVPWVHGADEHAPHAEETASHATAAEQAAAETARLMADPSTKVIYQATVHTPKYVCRADILERDPDGKGWHLYEVKSSTEQKPEHIQDIAFQAAVFKEANIPLYSLNLIHINKNYIFDEAAGLEIKKFFVKQDLTKKIIAEKHKFVEQMPEAHLTLINQHESHPQVLKKSFKYDPGETFKDYYYEGIPDYSIYDIGHIRKNDLTKLTQQGIMLIKDIPDNFFKQDFKNLQVQITKTEKPHIDTQKIARTLATLKYPLYFLDYETINPGIPLFGSTRPYQQICFQYSLHVQRDPKSKLEHYEFLHLGKDNPTPHLLKQLQTEIGPTGTVIVWNQTFEMGRNREMAKDYPEYRAFLTNVNSRVYDLMKIVDEDMYMDYRFMGSASIKNVLPVLVPELSYENLGIKDGNEAGDAWYALMENKAEDRDKTIKDMLTYCGQDTLAMVKILEVLRKS